MTGALHARRLTGLSIVQVASRILGLAALAAQLAFAARLVPPATLGALLGALAVLGIAGSFAEFGLTNTVVLELSRGGDEAEVFGEALRASAWLGSASVVFSVGVTAVLLPHSMTALLLLVPWFCLARLAVPLAALAQSRHDFGRLAVAEAGGRGLAAMLIFAALVADPSWTKDARVAAIAGALLAGAVFTVVVLGARAPVPARGVRGFRLIRAALPIGIANGASYVHGRVDQVVLGAYGYARALASYGIAYRVVDAGLSVALAVGNVAFPVLGRAEHGDRAALGRITGALVSVLALAMAVSVYWLARPIIVVMGGERYASAAGLLRLLAPVLLVSVLNFPAAQVVIVAGHVHTLLRIAAAMLGVNIVLNVLLVPLYQARGAAIASIVTETVGMLLVAAVASRAVRNSVDWSLRGATIGAFAALTVGVQAIAAYAGPVAGVITAVLGVVAAAAVMQSGLRRLVSDAELTRLRADRGPSSPSARRRTRTRHGRAPQPRQPVR